MREFFILHVEILYALFHYPIGLPSHLKRIPQLDKHLLLASIVASVSLSLGFYLLRDFYSSGFVFSLFMMTLVHMASLWLLAFLGGSVVDALVERRHPERAGRSQQMIAVIMLSFIPLVFFLPASFSARFLGELADTGRALFMVPVILALLAWSGYVVFIGIRYLYELTVRDAIWIQVKALGYILIFPLLFGVLLVQELVQLIG